LIAKFSLLTLVSGVTKGTTGAHVLGLSGEPMTWRAMVEAAAEAVGVRRKIVSLPLRPCIATAAAPNSVGIRPVHADIFRRFAEDVEIPEANRRDQLGVMPTSFREAFAVL
jgi:hypothetical protein